MKIQFRTNLDLSMGDNIVMSKLGTLFTEAPLVGHRIKWPIGTMGFHLNLEVVQVTHNIIGLDCPTREILVELHLPRHWDNISTFQEWYNKHRTA